MALLLAANRDAGLAANEAASVELGEGLANLLLRVHDDGAVPGYGLFNRLAGDEQEADAFGAGLDGDLVAAIEEDERVVGRVVYGRGVWVGGCLGEDSLRGRGIAEGACAGEDVGEGVARGLDLEAFALAGRRRRRRCSWDRRLRLRRGLVCPRTRRR